MSTTVSSVHDALGGSPLDPRLTFDSFVVGRSNTLAHSAAKAAVLLENSSIAHVGYIQWPRSGQTDDDGCVDVRQFAARRARDN